MLFPLKWLTYCGVPGRCLYKYHLAHWGLVARIFFGGLGVPNLRELNMSLLASWASWYFAGGDKNWLILLDHKYNTCKPNLLWSKPNVGSPFSKEATCDGT